jgi:predicted O-methyltransferase YrrM
MIDYHEIAQASKASQDKWELEELLKVVAEIKPTNILEIGVHLGRSMEVWINAFRPWYILGLERDTCYDYRHITEYASRRADVFTGVDSHSAETLQRVQDYFNPEKGDSGSNEIDFLFIDGDHLYDGVKADFEMYSPLVKKGGIVAFHDARLDDNPTCEVFKFWKEIKNQFTSKELFNPSGEGTGVGVLFL